MGHRGGEGLAAVRAALRSHLGAVGTAGPVYSLPSGDGAVVVTLAAWNVAVVAGRALVVALGHVAGAAPVTATTRKVIGDCIAAARHQRDMSQRELAAALVKASGRDTVTRNDVSRWERGVRIPYGHWRYWLGNVLRVQLPTTQRAAHTRRHLPTE